jgi:hypothetical protein
LRKYSIEPHVIICLSVEEVLNRTSCDNLHEVLLSTSTERQIITWGSIEYFLNWETNYHMRFYWVLPQLRDKLSHEELRKYSIEPHVIICLSVEEVLNRTSCDNVSLSWLRDKLSHEVLLSTSSTERQIITCGFIEYFLNWETNYHMRFYWVLPQLRDTLSHEVRKYSIEPHVIICLSVEEVLNRNSCDNLSRDKLSLEVLLSTSSTSRQIITWGSIEYFLNFQTNYHMRFYWSTQ